MLGEEATAAVAMADECEEVVHDDSGRAGVDVDMMAMRVLSCAALRGLFFLFGLSTLAFCTSQLRILSPFGFACTCLVWSSFVCCLVAAVNGWCRPRVFVCVPKCVTPLCSGLPPHLMAPSPGTKLAWAKCSKISPSCGHATCGKDAAVSAWRGWKVLHGYVGNGMRAGRDFRQGALRLAGIWRCIAPQQYLV